MPTWGQILLEVQRTAAAPQSVPVGLNAFDFVRRKYVAHLASVTGRNSIVYASRWLQPDSDARLVPLSAEDVHGFMEVVHGLNGESLDLVLHSPGGSPEAAEAIVSYLRSKFRDIRVIVPHAAMSAATMIACAANRLVLGRHSSLGPIDPQVAIRTRSGILWVPADAILEDFQRAQDDGREPARLGAWLPILQQVYPGLLQQCKWAKELAGELVERWLTDYLLAGDAATAKKVSDELGRHGNFKSHGRFLSRDRLRGMGLKDVIDDLETDQKLQDAVLSVYHAYAVSFMGTGAAKIVENHLGRAFVRIQVPRPAPPAAPLPQPPAGPS